MEHSPVKSSRLVELAMKSLMEEIHYVYRHKTALRQGNN